MRDHNYYVYILSNRSAVLYVGVTNNLARRVAEHRSGEFPGFCRQYALENLVYVEECGEVEDAIAREKQIKGWRRSKKVALIEKLNPRWDDLGEELLERDPSLRSG
ncbi:MAG TPA: GIY-YIG nuclease family protein [Verrucomicrobiae bacterium]|nr:GIY-YIG nuclease family protein [Verrucomicrobiae bacterium]